VSAYSTGVSSDKYNEYVYNFSSALAAISQNTFVSIYFDIDMTAAANVCRQRSREKLVESHSNTEHQ